MRRFHKTIVTGYLLIFLSGCAADLDQFDQPEVISVTPVHNATSVDDSTPVTVEFSRSMDTMKTADEFSLSSSSGSVSGYFSWENNDARLVFKPSVPLADAVRYTVRISESAEDSSGNDLRNEFVSVFYTGGDSVRPSLSSFSPGSGTIGNNEDTVIVFNFSEAMDMDTVYQGITISPSVQGQFTTDSGIRTITFTPLYGFNNGTTYTVTIDDSLRDAAGNRIVTPVAFSFTVGDDFIKPVLTAYQDTSTPLLLNENTIIHGAEKDAAILLDFSELIDTVNISDCISLSPSTDFYISRETVTTGSGMIHTRCTLVPIENLESETTYTLKISTAIKDIHGNNLDKEYRYVFVTDGATSVSPVVTEIGDYGGGVYHKWDMDIIQCLSPWAMLFDGITVTFSNQIIPRTAEVSIEHISGEGSGGVSIVNVDCIAPAYTQLTFGIYNASPGNTYRIKIEGGEEGLEDINGNYMKDDFVQIIKF